MKNVELYFEQLDYLINKYKKTYDKFDGSTIFVTGATGLIGFTLISSLLRFNLKYHKSIKIIGNIRNIKKAQEKYKIFSNYNKHLKFVINDIKNKFYINTDIDYIVHAAADTSSKQFINNPIEIIETAYLGTKNVLELAKEKKVKSFIFLSSMEVYGVYNKEIILRESSPCNIDTSDPRSSYPESKRLCETLCFSYYKEQRIPVKVVRLCTTVGVDLDKNDQRVVNYFAKCIKDKRNIILVTEGQTKRNYISAYDAITGILVSLINGKNGEIYNLADSRTYFSIKELANLFISFSNNSKLVFKIKQHNKKGYLNLCYYKLNNGKIKSLGWKPVFSINETIKTLIDTI